MENSIISNFLETNEFLEKNKIHFVNVEADPRQW
jgi:hypothetical protein